LIEDLQASGLQLPPELLVKADELINRQTVKGARYPAGAQADIDTEDFADE
ncbi:MAG TPA: aldo/keto reductase, partial [Alteromonas sp.]|nr:aldo/keto reductase [Alteromonas sp.]